MKALRCICFVFRLRCGSKQIAEKYFADENKKGRVEFVPVEWRSSLKLDEGVMDLVTPHTIRGVRNVINTSMMDIMYYTSPFYREEVSVYNFWLYSRELFGSCDSAYRDPL